MKKINKKGFTLTELLSVIAILVILFSLIGINVIRYVKTTKQTRLDKMAETVYLTAQNNLTKLNSTGSINELNKDVTGVNQLSDKPSDYDGDYSSRRFEYLSSLQSLQLARKLVPEGSIDEGYEYYIEYDVESADVYAVFIYEDETVANFYPSDAEALRTSKEARIQNGNNVGYYKGDVREIITKQTDKLVCDTVVINKEKLQDIIYVNMPDGHQNDKIELTITVKGKLSGKTKTITYDETNALLPACIESVEGNLNACVRQYILTLDKLSEAGDEVDLSFAAQFKADGFYPGENIVVSVVAKDKTDNTIAATSPISDTTNSLYASVVNDKANIYYIRHLENLSNYDYSHLDVINAVQKRDLDFNNNREEEYYNVYGTRRHVPINNVDINSYDGNGYYISNLKTTVSGNAGLFGEFNGKSLSNIVLINANIAGSGNVGGLAGVINNATEGEISITNCYSYLKYPISEFDVDAYISGNNCGGLVGTITNSTNNTLSIKNSFASTTISGAAYVGGLIGNTTKSISIQKSYADSYLAGNVVGGLAGGLGGSSTISTSYAAGFLVGNATTVAGITPSTIGSISQSYTVFSSDSSSVTNRHSTIGGGTVTNTYYLTMDNITNTKGQEKTADDFKDAENTLSLGNSFRYQNNNAYPYNLNGLYLDTEYPYPTIINDGTTAHSGNIWNYGDWEETEGIKYTILVKNINGNGEDDYSYNVGLDQQLTIANPTRDGYSFMGWSIYDMDTTEHIIDGISTTDNYLEEVYATTYRHLRETEGTVTFVADWIDEKEGRITFFSREKGSAKKIKFEDGTYLHRYDTENENSSLSGLLGSIELLADENILQEGYILTGWKMERYKAATLLWSDITNDHITINVENNDWTFDVTEAEAETAKAEISDNDLLFSEWGDASKVKFYPVYKLKKYAITYDFNTGTVDESLNPKEYTIETEKITLKNPTKNHYDFVGWYNVETDKKVETIPKGSTGDLSLKAKWVPHDYSITYVMNGGTNSSDNPTTYNIESSAVTLIDPTKAGNRFSGWYSDSSFTNKVTTIDPSSYGDNIGNITLYAKWDEGLILIANGEEYRFYPTVGGINNNNRNTLNGLNDIDEKPYVQPTRDGFEFKGWYLETSEDNYTKVLNADGSILNEWYRTYSGITEDYWSGMSHRLRFDVSGAPTLVAGWESTKDIYARVTNISNLRVGDTFVIANRRNSGDGELLSVKDGTLYSDPVTVSSGYIDANEVDSTNIWKVAARDYRIMTTFNEYKIMNNGYYLTNEDDVLGISTVDANNKWVKSYTTMRPNDDILWIYFRATLTYWNGSWTLSSLDGTTYIYEYTSRNTMVYD